MMKKFLVLGILFILPIAIYLFFASGVNNFARLPIITENVNDVDGLQSLSGENITFEGKITVLGFLGNNIREKKINAFNLNQKIYKRFNGFDDFQFVMVLPTGVEEEVKELKKELSPLADVVNWKFIFTSKFNIERIFNSLELPLSLDQNMGTPYVFILDKEKKLRGRDDNDKDGSLYGYNATSVAELNDKMIDDLKVVLAEYRLALKKNGVSKRDSYLKINSNEK